MHVNRLLAIGFASASLLGALSSQAATLNVDFDGHHASPATSAGTFGGTGPSGVGGLWNGLDIIDTGRGVGTNGTFTANSTTNNGGTTTTTTNNFEYNDGSASPITSIVTAGFGSADANSGVTNATVAPLLNDYLVQNGTATVTLNGVASDTYTLIVFGTNGRGTVGGTFAVNGGTAQATTGTGSASAGFLNTATDKDYVTFTGVTPVGGVITISAAPGGSVAGVGVINGFQLIGTPEPASISMLALGSLGLLTRRRATR